MNDFMRHAKQHPTTQTALVPLQVAPLAVKPRQLGLD
jgi:hypothetical protein